MRARTCMNLNVEKWLPKVCCLSYQKLVIHFVSIELELKKRPHGKLLILSFCVRGKTVQLYLSKFNTNQTQSVTFSKQAD